MYIFLICIFFLTYFSRWDRSLLRIYVFSQPPFSNRNDASIGKCLEAAIIIRKYVFLCKIDSWRGRFPFHCAFTLTCRLSCVEFDLVDKVFQARYLKVPVLWMNNLSSIIKQASVYKIRKPSKYFKTVTTNALNPVRTLYFRIKYSTRILKIWD